MYTQLTFSTNDSKNMAILGPDGAVLYTVHTPSSGLFSSAPTSIITSTGVEDARIEFKTIGDSTVLHHGQVMRIKDMLPKRALGK